MHRYPTTSRLKTQVFADNGGRRLRFADPIEETVFTLLPGAPVTLRETWTDAFYFPVTTASACNTFCVKTTNLVQVFVRDAGGDIVRKVAAGESAGLPAPDDEYSFEIPSVGCKVYLRTDAPVRVLSDDRATVREVGTEFTYETRTPGLTSAGERARERVDDYLGGVELRRLFQYSHTDEEGHVTATK